MLTGSAPDVGAYDGDDNIIHVSWQGAVSSVEPGKPLPDGGSAAGGRITLADGQHVEYDWLVLALGSETSTFGIPGARELATPFCTYIDALKVPC